MSISIGILKGYLQLEDNFSNPMLNAEKRFSAAVNNITKAGEGLQTVGKGLTAVGAAFTALAAVGVSASSSLNNSLGNLQSIIGGPLEESTKHVQGLKGELQSLGPQVGKGIIDLSEGFYELQSSLGDTGENMELLEINAKAARAGMASTQDAIKFTTAVTKTYGDTTAEATQKVVDLGFQAVNIGQTTFPELAAAIGGVAPLAKETGVSLEEMFAVLATATGVTGNTNEVITQMASAITAVVSPSKDMAEAYEAMGVKSGEALIRQEGLVGALQKIAQEAKNADKPLIDLVGRKEAWILASSLAGSQAEKFSGNLTKMGESAGATDAAFKAQTEGINKAGFMWDQFKVKLEVIAQNYGDKLIPILVRFGESMLPVLDMVLKGIQLFDQLPQPVQTTAIALGALAIATGPAVYGLGRVVTMVGEIAGQRGLQALTKEAPKLVGTFIDIGTGATSLSSVLASAGTRLAGFSVGATTLGSVATIAGTKLAGFGGALLAFATGPIGITIAAVTAVVAGIRYFTGSWQETWNVIKLGIPLLYAIELGYKGIIAAFDYLRPALDAAVSLFRDSYTVISFLVKGALSDFYAIVTNIASTGLSYLATGLQTMKGFFVDVYSAAQNLTTLFMNELNGSMGTVLQLTLAMFPALGQFVAGLKLAWEWGQKYWEMLVNARQGLRELADAINTEMPKVKVPEMFANAKPALESADALIDRMNKLIPGEKELRVAIDATNRGYGSLTEQLAEANEAVGRITASQKKQIDAGLKMGLNSKEVAEAVNKMNLGVKLTAQTVDLYRDRLTQGSKSTKEFEKDAEKTAKVLEEGVKSMSRAIDGYMKDIWADQITLAKESAKAIEDALTAKIQAEENAARMSREMTMGELEFKLDAIFREGEARKKAITAFGTLATEARLAIDNEISTAMQKAVLESGSFKDVLTEIGQNVPTVFQPFVGILENIGAETDKTKEKTKSWKEGVKDLAAAFGNLAESGGPLGGFGAVAAQVVGAADVAIESFTRVKTGLDDLADKAKGSIATAFADIATGMISGVGAMMSATDPSKGMMSRILGGAATGAALGLGVAAAVTQFAGSMSAAGPWAMAAGAIIGVFIGVFRGRAARREMEIVGQEWGQDISQGLFDKISKSTQFKGDRVANSIFNMKDFISEAGGLDSSNIDRFMGKLRDVFVMVGTHQFTLAEGQRVLNDNFRDFAQVSLDSGGIASKQLQEIIRLNTEMGLNAAAVIEFVAGQTVRASSGLIAIGAPIFTEIGKWHESVTATEAKLKELSEAGKEGTAEWLEQQEKLTALSREHSELVVKNATDLDNLGIVAMAAYGAALKSGVGYVEAIRAAGPALDSVISAQQKLGITTENEALKGLLIFRDKVRQNEELVTAAEGLNDTLLAISHTTGLNADSLRAMGDLGMSTFKRLIEAGFSNNEALRMMSGFLENVMQGHLDLQIPIEGNTKELLEMAEAEGALKTKSKDMKDVFLEGTTSMVDAINRLIDTLNRVPTSVDGIGKAIDRVPKQVRVDWEFNIPEVPEGVIPRHSYRGGTNGLVDFGEGTWALLHNKEAVLTENEYKDVMSPDQHAFGTGVMVSQYNDFRGAFTDDLAGQQRFLKRIEDSVSQSVEMRRLLGR
jgi:TP901 family phage tail tape measure protein